MKIKGLIFRELYLERKNYLLSGILVIVILTMGILMRLSMLYGNLASQPKEDLETLGLEIFYIFTYVPIFIMISQTIVNNNVFFLDCSSGWMKLSYTTPVSAKKYVGVTYLIKIGIVTFSIILNTVYSAILCKLFDRRLDGKLMTGVFSMVLIIILVGEIFNQFAYKYKDIKKTQNTVLVIVMAFLVVLVFLFYMWRNAVSKADPSVSDEQFLGMVKDKMLLVFDSISQYVFVIPVAIIAIMGIGYFLSVRAMNRREE